MRREKWNKILYTAIKYNDYKYENKITIMKKPKLHGLPKPIIHGKAETDTCVTSKWKHFNT